MNQSISANSNNIIILSTFQFILHYFLCMERPFCADGFNLNISHFYDILRSFPHSIALFLARKRVNKNQYFAFFH